MWAEAGAGEEVSGWKDGGGGEMGWGAADPDESYCPSRRKVYGFAIIRINILISVGREPGAGHGKCIS